MSLHAPKPVSDHAVGGNRILTMLSRVEYRRLQPTLEPVSLPTDAVLYAPGDVVRHLYFPNDAVISLLHAVNTFRTVEIAMAGNEAAVGLAEFLGGAKSCNLTVVRNPGSAMRMSVSILRGRDHPHARLQELVHRSVHALVTQMAQLAVCNRFHTVDARLARWLLMTRDRVGAREIQATHEVISRMLGVRRSGITAAAAGFQRQGTIDYCRGRIEVLDPRGLRAAACCCYGIIKSNYDDFLR